jgi:hypothetical protein
MHADQTENYSLAYFGNEAEKKYHQEYLVCGQADAKPSPYDTEEYKAFSMSKNRCCREIGSDLTTFTSYIPLKQRPISASDYNTTSYNLKMTYAPGTDPKDPLRYSRLATVENLGTTSDRPPLNAYQTRPSTPILDTVQGYNVLTPYQWKTLGEANSEGCCGGGWVRKFSDGSNDWSRRDRVYMDVKNFACINSRTPLLTHPEDVKDKYGNDITRLTTLLGQDYGDYCKDSSGIKGSCAQFSIANSSSETSPIALSNSSFLFETLIPSFVDSNKNFYFAPRSADSNPAITLDFTNTAGRRNFKFKLPSFIPDSQIGLSYSGVAPDPSTRVRIYSKDVPSGYLCAGVPAATSFNFTLPTTSSHSNCDALDIADDGALTGSISCCFQYDSTTRILSVIGTSYLRDYHLNVLGDKKWGVRLTNYIGGAEYNIQSAHQDIISSTPGSSTFYLKRMGLLELSGIPQITYKPIMCNDNVDRLVPGIFKKPLGVTDMKLNDFIPEAVSFYDPSSASYMTNAKGLDHEPVFSENDFKCCSPLGKTTNDQSKCCSGFGNPTPSGTYYSCALPVGTDLMVYFNRFVTNEGRGTDQPGGGLVDADFTNLTGEPIVSVSVSQKISILGKTYCSSGNVRQGGTFGAFNLEPIMEMCLLIFSC